MKILDKIRIGSVDYDIRQTDKNVVVDCKACYGAIHYSDHVIELDSKLCDRQRMELTLLHEVFHGILHERAIRVENEEELVEGLARGMHQILRDNPEMFGG